MLQRIILAIAIFLIILVALTFGESVARQLFAWISHITGMVIYSFSDVYVLVRDYVQSHTGKVVLALVLTVPIWLWVLRSKGSELRRAGINRKIAIVLAIFLGWLGAHRFYIGQIGWGIGYLILFYLFPPLAVIAGFIDAIRYLFMSDQEFPGTGGGSGTGSDPYP